MRLRAKTILITGASSGLGLHTAVALAQAGHRVFAGARSFSSGEVVEEPFTPLSLDVTDQASIAAAVAQVNAEAGPIDVLIHCAARIVLGSCEDTSPAETQAVLQTNFMGVVAVTQAVLSQMRANGGGLIVPFSSINGILATPFTSAYVASKHALEGWAACLRMETQPFGIRVCVVRPGDHRSGNAASRQRAALSKALGSPYGADCAKATATIARDEANGLYPANLAKAIVRIVNAKRPPCLRTVARIDQLAATWLHDILPARTFSRILRVYYIRRNAQAQQSEEQ